MVISKRQQHDCQTKTVYILHSVNILYSTFYIQSTFYTMAHSGKTKWNEARVVMWVQCPITLLKLGWWCVIVVSTNCGFIVAWLLGHMTWVFDAWLLGHMTWVFDAWLLGHMTWVFDAWLLGHMTWVFDAWSHDVGVCWETCMSVLVESQ